jgi:hypothetical protein
MHLFLNLQREKLTLADLEADDDVVKLVRDALSDDLWSSSRDNQASMR